MWIQGDVAGAPLTFGAFSGCYCQALATVALASYAFLVLNDSPIREEDMGDC